MAAADTRRGALLRAALGFVLLVPTDAPRSCAPVAWIALRHWMTSWAAIGRMARGMARQGYDLSLIRYDDLGWRATFYVSGREHSPTRATASAFTRSLILAVQMAAWEALAKQPTVG